MQVLVVVSMTVNNVNFDSLSANATLLSNFKTEMQTAVVEATGVNASQVNITLSKGSVVVRAEITPAPGQAAALETAVGANTTGLQTAAASKAAAVPGITAVSSGPITVSLPTVANTAPTAAPTVAPTVAPTAAPTAATGMNGSNTNATTTAAATLGGGSADGAMRLAALDFVTMLACAGLSVTVLGSM
jgi:hypothetical protein